MTAAGWNSENFRSSAPPMELGGERRGRPGWGLLQYTPRHQDHKTHKKAGKRSPRNVSELPQTRSFQQLEIALAIFKSASEAQTIEY
jgi:hypothetical protein